MCYLWNVPCPGAEVCVGVCVRLFSQTDYLPQFPFASPHALSMPSIQTAARCVSQVQSLNSISLPEETLSLLRLYRVVGNIPALILPVQPPKVTHSASDTVFMARSRRRAPVLLQAYCFGGFCRGTCRCVGFVLSLRVQGEYKRFWIDILGASLIHRADWDIYHTGSKGQEDFPVCGQLTFVKHWCACSP